MHLLGITWETQVNLGKAGLMLRRNQYVGKALPARSIARETCSCERALPSSDGDGRVPLFARDKLLGAADAGSFRSLADAPRGIIPSPAPRTVARIILPARGDAVCPCRGLPMWASEAIRGKPRGVKQRREARVGLMWSDQLCPPDRLLLNPPTQVPEIAKLQGARSAS